MIKYTGYSIVLQEVPDEISLALEISNCPYRCKGCHSPRLQQDVGEDLEPALDGLLQEYAGRITCVCFMGEGNDPQALKRCLKRVRAAGLKTCLYSGGDWGKASLMHLLNYYKVGAYDASLGGLDTPGTNQKMYKILPAGTIENITYLFQRKRGG